MGEAREERLGEAWGERDGHCLWHRPQFLFPLRLSWKRFGYPDRRIWVSPSTQHRDTLPDVLRGRARQHECPFPSLVAEWFLVLSRAPIGEPGPLKGPGVAVADSSFKNPSRGVVAILIDMRKTL